ncbi:TauD/TfdA family dioxygenase [Lentibacter sp. XHP0401]|uniref:TauD/TfdA family dioxygenase n=1 Tax=Lentibacter sp. XHP0401 TaxID=2984334 RepID=UPI0021E991DB|nr:TauD/TfdA family dioxygenase [Lentibacter sp. XHP0401]MCV2894562.1 TauD/TfdA family dioxygenase [Lentibacter sp. XHP0401]
MPESLIENEGRVLRVNGQRFHAIWLRDNVQDGQRPAALATLPANLGLSAAVLRGDSLEITFAPEDKTAVFALQWLKDHAYDTPQERSEGHIPANCTPWGAGFASAVPAAPLPALLAYEATKYSWLDAIRSFGFAKVTELVDREPAFRDVVAIFDPLCELQQDQAMSSHGQLPATAAPYREPVPSLKLLINLNPSLGGEIILVDGFACALRLMQEDPEGFTALTAHSNRFADTSRQGEALHSRRQIIELLPEGTLQTIRFNPRFAAPVTDVPFDRMETYYRAYRRFAELVDSPEMQITLPLAAGEALLLDNTRVLQGRKPSESENACQFQSCFAQKDRLLSALAALEASL